MSSRAFQIRCLVLCSILVIGLSALSVRLIQLQVWDRKELGDKARRAHDRREILTGLRGRIVDRNEEVLAKSMPVSTIFVDISHLRDPKVMADTVAYARLSRDPGWESFDETTRRRRIKAERGEVLVTMPADAIREAALAHAINVLSRPLGLLREEMREMIAKGLGDRQRGEFILAKNIPDDVAGGLRDLVDQHWIEGFRFAGSYKRWYTSRDLAAHVIGYTGESETKDDAGRIRYTQTGKFGIEAALDEFLAGKDGWREQKRNAYGMRIPGDSGSIRPPRAGLNVQLTLDTSIQAIVEEELDWGLAEFEAPRGCAIVLDPKTGEILGMASRPGFNPNRLDNLDEAGMNFALQAAYEPGSTIKVVATSGALNERLVSPQTTIFCHNGFYTTGKITVKDPYPYGNLTFEGVLAKSSNIGTFKLGQQLGMARFYDYLDRYGFGGKTGILLSGESSGRVRKTGNPMDFSRATYGYALSVTPLQVAQAYGAIAFDGKLRRPHIVRSIIANDGTVVENYEPEAIREVLRPEAARTMRRALEKVTGESGTAKRARVPGFRVAGKTGTAERLVGGKYQKHRNTVSFAGMLPAEDPAFVCVVVIDDPRTTKVKQGGGTMAAPCFARIAARTAAHLNLTPTEPVDDKLAGTPQP